MKGGQLPESGLTPHPTPLPLIRDKVMLLGIEAHVCVLQTTLDLLERGYEVHLLVDGISSQRGHDRAVALQRMAHSGGFSQLMLMLLSMMGITTTCCCGGWRTNRKILQQT